MLTLSRPLSSGKVAEYFRHQDPIIGSPGTWQGKGAEHLGLRGKVQAEAFDALLKGNNPETGDRLREKAKTGHDRAAVDMVLSPPKSMSIVAINDTSIIEAHHKAVFTAIDHMESYAQTRQQINGIRATIVTGNLIAAKFNHFLSRSLDPQLHSHLVVMNLTQLSDGHWRALDNRPLYQHQLDIGQCYRTELAQQLLDRDFQLNIIDNYRNFFEIKGVPEELISSFSSRREKLANPSLLDNLRESYPLASEARIHELATYMTRPGKEIALSKDDILRSWQDLAREKGYDLDQLQLPRTPSKDMAVELNITNTPQLSQELVATSPRDTHLSRDHSGSSGPLADFLSDKVSNTLEHRAVTQEHSR